MLKYMETVAGRNSNDPITESALLVVFFFLLICCEILQNRVESC